MSLPETVAVLGLGLMGGSLAKDLSAAGTRVVGYDRVPGVAAEALAQGDLAAVLDESLSGLSEAEVIVLATPVDSATDILQRLVPLVGPGTVVTDLGSTKASIVEAAEKAGLGVVFVGSHPLAGDHRSGWSAARTGLYRGATVYISPTSASSPGALSTVEALWEKLGATCSRISAGEHDRLMAWISHLPQVVSSAVAASLADAGYARTQLGPGGRDVTRLAASSPEMWTAIALTNERSLLAAVESVRKQLQTLEKALSERDTDALKDYFSTGSDWSR